MSNSFKNNGLYFVPLGGSEQFGANLNLYVCDGQFLAVDCGLCFADERYPGIDLLLPDPQILEDNKKNLKGVVLTHAHEDHIGALAYLWERFECPVYTTRFTAAVLRGKLEQEGLDDVPVHIMDASDPLKVGCFTLSVISMSHSVPDSFSLLIETSYGRLFHSGDWNLDQNSPVGQKVDENLVCKIGNEGVLAYIGDSTNAEYDGYSGSEADVAKGLVEEFKKCQGKIAITIFSSNIARMISIARAAKEVGRSVGLVGRSLHRMAGCAHECGMLDDIPPFLDENEFVHVPDENLVLIVTGSQGEYRAALAKIARGDFNNVSLGSNDTVIFSARAIPGNEKNINTVKNNLSAANVRIVTPKDTHNIIHVSGHPYRDEIEQMLKWIKPSCVVPVHGEHMQLSAQAGLASSCQIEYVIVPNNGSVIHLAPEEPKIIDHVETALLAVDKTRIIPATHQSISARRKLQYSGTLHVSAVIDDKINLIGKIKISTIGLSCRQNNDCLVENLQKEAEKFFASLSLEERSSTNAENDDEIAEMLRILLRRYVNQYIGLQPKTTVHITTIM